MVVLCILLTRLPFLEPGYGLDADAWRVARVAKVIAETGVYEYSRMPGHAPHELLVSLVADAPAWVLNLMTAAVSAVAAALFWMILRHFEVRDALLATFAFALTPIVYIESVELLDYQWSIALVLAATCAVLEGRPRLAGALLGLAIGFGITIAGMLLPLSLMAMSARGDSASGRDRLAAAAGLILATTVVGALCFLPPYLRYGPAFLELPSMQPHSVAVAVWMASVGLMGIPGAPVAALVIAGALWGTVQGRSPTVSMRAQPPRLVAVAWLSVPIVYALFYLCIRGEPSKLIPVVPFLILLLARYAGRRSFAALCAALAISPFTGQLVEADLPDVPSIIGNQAARRAEFERIENIWRSLEALPGRVILVTGSYFAPKLELTRPASVSDRVGLVSWITAEDVETRVAEGVTIVCLREACNWNQQRTGADPRDHGASVLAESE